VTAVADPVLQAVLDAAIGATAAAAGWLLAVDGDELEVVAASGTGPRSLVGERVPAGAGMAGFVVGSGQPIALALRPDDPRATSGMAQILGRRPTTTLCVPCESAAGVSGALEVIDKAGSASFTFDDVELATLLAGVAGVALGSGPTGRLQVPTPAQLAGDLDRLLEADPSRYAVVASVVAALMGDA
jgi:GAF domain-containing protein